MQQEPFVTRWICEIDEGRYIMFDDEEDVEDWDEVLEIKIPATMAVNMDFTQHAYYTFQRYCELQWEIVKRKMEAETGGEYEETEADALVNQEFEAIIRNSKLDDIVKGSDEAED